MSSDVTAKVTKDASNFLSAFGLPKEVRIKNTSKGLKVIPLGDIDLEVFGTKNDVDVWPYSSITLNGVNRNTDFIVTYQKRKKTSNERKASDLDERFESGMTRIEKAIDRVVAACVDMLAAGEKREFKTIEDRLPEKIRKNYDVSGDLGDVKNWKANVYLANSCNKEDPQVGDMCEVGYTMINTDTGEMIPVARSDEHHMGYDLIHHLISKKLVQKGRYYPIFFGANYVYDEELEIALKAFKIWRDNGGENTVVNSSGNGEEQWIVRIDDFIKANGKIKAPKGDLAPIGKRLVRHLERCALTIRDHHAGKDVKEGRLADCAQMIISELSGAHLFYRACESLSGTIKQFRQDGQLKPLEEALFSHNGFKNTIHMEIRNILSGKGGFSSRDIAKVFGDVEFANVEFNRIGSI